MRGGRWIAALALCLYACRVPRAVPPDPITPILEAFESDDPNVRQAAGERLRELAPAHEQRLKALLKEASDPEVRARLEDALRPRAVPVVDMMEPSHTYTMTVVSVSGR